MSQNHSGTAGLHSFERNNYFYGKLLTVRDMAAEQAYHTDIQRTLARHVSGWGGVCGLEVTADLVTDEDDDESLEVTVSEGLALDRCGRLVVIADSVTETLAVPVRAEENGTEVETDTVSVYVEYDECLTEPVPVAKTESACDDRCEDNRVVETAKVRVEAGEPDGGAKPVAEVEFPDPADLGETDDRFAERVTVRGDVTASSIATTSSTTSSLDLVFAEGVPPGTARMALTVDSPDGRIVGRLSLPTGQFLDEEGLRVPDGEFDVTGTVTLVGENDRRSTDLTGSLEIRDGPDEVTVAGVLDADPQTEGEFDFDVAFDRTDDGFALERTFVQDAPVQQEATLSLDVSLSALDDDRLATGEMSLTLTRGSGENRVEYPLFTLETTEWEREDGQTFEGVFVDAPEREGTPPTEAEIDHLLAAMARSYYENERTESCPGPEPGPILVGTVTRDGESWADTTFERGPLVYTNDLLYDVLARHVSDFENPHDVKLEVGGGAVADGGPAGRHADAALGVEGPAGPEGTVGITSSDGSIDVTADRGFQTLDFTTDVGVDAAFERYHVYERSLQATAESFTELVADSNSVWAPQVVTHLAFRVARTAMHAVEAGVHESTTEYVEYLTGPHQSYYPEEQLPMTASANVLAHTAPEVVSVVDLERLLLSALDPNDEVEPFVPVRNYRRALETLEAHLDDDRSTTEKAADVARAQHRVAAAAETVLDSHPAVVGRFERGSSQAYPRVGRAVVPELDEVSGLDDVVGSLRFAGWTYLLQSQSVTPEDALDDHVNQVVAATPEPGSGGHKAAGVRLTVVDPPTPERVDEIGPSRRRTFARVGIETIAELAVADPEVTALVTGVTVDTASTWTWKAARYCDAYVLTGARHVGLLEAEALAEAEMNLEGYVFRDLSSLSANELDVAQLKADLEEAEGAIASKYRNALLDLDWEAVRSSL